MNDELQAQTAQLITAIQSLHDDVCYVLAGGFLMTGLIVIVMSVCVIGALRKNRKL
jgi:hypothetical protein